MRARGGFLCQLNRGLDPFAVGSVLLLFSFLSALIAFFVKTWYNLSQNAKEVP